ncbi:methionyl aminopeptidase [Mobilisporobacter senegalensis]|uniref:Methionine aminopeptidase n=1 Tax=Mobilisporobacter senegalensis TaxID=1329262 RepID=A0A3N1XMD9_9FIRM|nr:methionyl aminopeptidase [Mobilisporobacter senegalensis]ROR27348.1 methionyl aminopeptidase [Mobilisporobacter senegalensis]
MKLNRNDLCWCGSHKKYKSCHLAFDEKLDDYGRNGVLVPSHKMIKTQSQIEGVRKAGIINTKILDMVADYIKEGMTTEDINTFVHNTTINLGGIPAPLGFEGYPKSVCASINNQVCHGIPEKNTILKNGDIINIDVTTIVEGFYADSSRMFSIGDISEDRKKLIQVAKECLDLGFEQAKPYGYLGDIGEAINEHAEKNGYSIVREIGGHGVGIDFHEEPWVGHIGRRGTGMLLVPGMIFTIEPMVNAGLPDVYEDKSNGWTIYTKDEKDSAQWEYTILITETGGEILAR